MEWSWDWPKLKSFLTSSDVSNLIAWIFSLSISLFLIGYLLWPVNIICNKCSENIFQSPRIHKWLIIGNNISHTDCAVIPPLLQVPPLHIPENSSVYLYTPIDFFQPNVYIFEPITSDILELPMEPREKEFF